MAVGIEARLAELLASGARVAVGDGCGAPRSLHGPLTRLARGRELRLVLGWMPSPAAALDTTAFADVRVLMGGPGVRHAIDAGHAGIVPARLSAVPSLLSGPLRPDLLLTTVVRRSDGLHLGAEVCYLRGLIEGGVPTAAVVAPGPCADAGPPLPADRLIMLGETDDLPTEIVTPPPGVIDEQVAKLVAGLVPEGARVQVGPGRLASAIASALEVPVRFDSGLLPDAVVDLDARGLLIEEPVATYLCGTRRLYDWADGRGILHPIEITHDIGRLSAAGAPPLVALNAALEIDVDGAVNVEGSGRSAAGMIGGHPDFAAAGVRGAGLSVIALASSHAGRPTLVRRLSRPVTTPSHDVDLVVTERGIADLRGLMRAERRQALLDLWGGQVHDSREEARA